MLQEVTAMMTIEEQIERIYEHIAKVEITAIKASSTSAEAKAKLRVFEEKVYRLLDENCDLREAIRKLTDEGIKP